MKVLNLVNSFKTNSIILDVGCGNGKNMGHREDCKYIGVDICENLLKQAKQQNNCEYILSNCLNIPLLDNSIDYIMSIAVIHHLSTSNRRLASLMEIYRVLKKSGKFYVSVPDLDILFHAFRSTLLDIKIKKHILGMVFGGQEDKHDFHYFGYNFEILEDFLKLAGFSKIEKVKSFGLFEDTSEFKPYGFPISLNVVAEK